MMILMAMALMSISDITVRLCRWQQQLTATTRTSINPVAFERNDGLIPIAMGMSDQHCVFGGGHSYSVTGTHFGRYLDSYDVDGDINRAGGVAKVPV